MFIKLHTNNVSTITDNNLLLDTNTIFSEVGNISEMYLYKVLVTNMR
jgi:hypothetical protein